MADPIVATHPLAQQIDPAARRLNTIQHALIAISELIQERTTCEATDVVPPIALLTARAQTLAYDALRILGHEDRAA